LSPVIWIRISMLAVTRTIKTFHTWWSAGQQRSLVWKTGWRIYLYSHLFIVMLLVAELTPCMRVDVYLKDLPQQSGLLLNALVWIGILSAPVLPFVSVWILRLSRRQGPSFVAFGVVDMLLCATQWLTLWIGCTS